MKPLWEPSRSKVESSTLSDFTNYCRQKFSKKAEFPDQTFNYIYFHQWSIKNIESFWELAWDYFNIKASSKGHVVLNRKKEMLGSQFFPNARLNYAENLMRGISLQSSALAIAFRCEDKVEREVSHADLYSMVSKCAQFLQDVGVKKSDRVAAILPNCPEAVAAMIATTSIGAIWSSASPDFGVQGVMDRFGQIEPKVLFVVDSYWYNGKKIDCTEKNQQISQRLSSLEKIIEVSLVEKNNCSCKTIENNTTDETSRAENPKYNFWENIQKKYPIKEILYKQVEFNHPLFIMYSSGTTGVPKCIVHGHGGTLLQHLKEHQFHGDIKAQDRVFYFTTLGWMMWNWLVSALASQAVLLLYDGSPFAKNEKSNKPEGSILFDFAEKYQCTHFGTSAKYIDTCAKMNLIPQATHNLKKLKTIFSTGSPLSPESFDYVYSNIKSDVQLASISGGTDIISCFMLGNPWQSVYRGEIQGPGLAMDIKVYSEDEEKELKQNEKGELVCVQPFPSMPIGFWNDVNNKKYFDAYFSKYKNLWCHGDYICKTENNGFVIYGRSDSVLNPGGIRIGTAEIYRQVEKLPEILESIVVGQDWQSDVRVVLFVKLQENINLTEELQNKIKKVIRENTTPRHVPAKILQVKDIPRTKSGKIVELAVRKVIHNEPVKNIEALANPEALEYFKNRKELVD